jgi:hypothetical protein
VHGFWSRAGYLERRQGLVYGAAAGLNYFVIDRLSLGVNAGAIFASSYRDYSVGPALTYFVGPFGGYLFTPSYSATKHFCRAASTLKAGHTALDRPNDQSRRPHLLGHISRLLHLSG